MTTKQVKLTHRLVYTDRSETHEGSHGHEWSHRYKIATCSCGWTTEAYDSGRSDAEAILHTRLIEHKIDVLLAHCGVEFIS